jgi:DNA mismatch endonuclease (patch repair protein)
LIGKPDFVFETVRLAVFVDGCFWHGCKRCKRPPKSNASFWLDKVRTNQLRDRRVASTLRQLGWRVIRVKECDLQSVAHTKVLLAKIEEILQ